MKKIDGRKISAQKIILLICCFSLVQLSGLWRTAQATETGDTAQNPNARSAGDAIQTTCVTGANGEEESALHRRFQDDCDALVGGAFRGDPGVSSALGSIAIDQISAQNSVATGQAKLQAGVVKSRLISLRASTGSPVYALSDNPGLNLYAPYPRGGGASADFLFGSLGAFFNIKYAHEDYNDNTYEEGYDANIYGGTAGVDYQIKGNAIVGAALSYDFGDVDYDHNAGRLHINDWGATLYGSYFLDNGLFIDATLGYGRTDYDMKRKIRYTLESSSTVVRQTAKSDPDGNRYSASIGGGYEFSRSAWTITPTARLDYIRNDVDSFREDISDKTADGGGMAMSVDSNNYSSLTSSIGGLITYSTSHSWGVLVPQVNVEWIHEFENDQQSIDGFFIADVNKEGFVVKNRSPDRDYFNLGAGVVGQFAEGKSAFMSVDTVLGYKGLDYYGISGGIRIEFY